MDLLIRFNGDIHTKEALLAYLVSFNEAKIVEYARDGKDVKGIAEALKVIEESFEQLDVDYGIKSKSPAQINEAR